MAVYSWKPVPPESGVIYYQIERETPRGYEFVAKIPNTDGHEFYDTERQRFVFKDPGLHTLRIAAVSNDAVGEFSYIYPPTPLPPPPIPTLDIQKPSDVNVKLEVSPKWRRIGALASGGSPPPNKNGTLILFCAALGVVVLMRNGKRR